MTNAQIAERLQQLEQQNRALQDQLAAAQKRPANTLVAKVSAKGAVSVYGLQRMPVTLYAEQWDRLLAFGESIREFVAANRKHLTFKNGNGAALSSRVSSAAQTLGIGG